MSGTDSTAAGPSSTAPRNVGAEQPEETTTALVTDMVDSYGMGYYQLAVLIAAGSACLAECAELGAVEPLNAAFSSTFGLPLAMRAALPALHYLGAGVGIALSGPLCDRFGRKGVLVFSNAACILAQGGTAFLPVGVRSSIVIGLRCLAGGAVGLGVPAGAVLVVESCPRACRATLMYSVSFLSNVGYLLCAIGLHMFMPHFGEEPTDQWRTFCIFSTIPAMFSLPFTAFLVTETPAFHAASGDIVACKKALTVLATANGHPAPSEDEVAMALGQAAGNHAAFAGQAPSGSDVGVTPQACANAHGKSLSFLDTIGFKLLSASFSVFILLSMIDTTRGFMIAGTSYLWPQLFELSVGSTWLPPSGMNIVTELAPMLGLVIGHHLAWLGLKQVVFGGSILAGISIVALISSSLRSRSQSLMVLVMLTKLTYGPISTCVSLMKVQSFPVEIRATAFAMISLFVKLGIAFAPSLLEVLKESQWTVPALDKALQCLATSCVATGCLALLLPHPEAQREGERLQPAGKSYGAASAPFT